jgi:hypothetical protein
MAGTFDKNYRVGQAATTVAIEAGGGALSGAAGVLGAALFTAVTGGTGPLAAAVALGAAALTRGLYDEWWEPPPATGSRA